MERHKRLFPVWTHARQSQYSNSMPVIMDAQENCGFVIEITVNQLAPHVSRLERRELCMNRGFRDREASRRGFIIC